eukprot:3215831-Rhodomonas_salina.7
MSDLRLRAEPCVPGIPKRDSESRVRTEISDCSQAGPSRPPRRGSPGPPTGARAAQGEVRDPRQENGGLTPPSCRPP